MERKTPLTVCFYRAPSGSEPARAWLQTLTKEDKFRIGVDSWKAQSEWPIGMPHVRSLGSGIARVIFLVEGIPWGCFTD